MKKRAPRGQKQKLLLEELKSDIEGVMKAREWRVRTQRAVKLYIKL